MSLFDEIVVQHPNFAQALDLVEDFERRTEAGEKLLLPIFGPTRVGKNSATSMLQYKYRSYDVDGVRIKPLVLVKTPTRPTLSSLPESILIALGMRAWSNVGTTSKLTAHAMNCLKRCQAKYVILDEFQHFAELGSNKINRNVSDWLKNFYDESGVSVILLGLPAALRALDSNEQLRDRALAPHHLLPYNWLVEKEQIEFSGAFHELLKEIKDIGYVLNFDEAMDLPMYIASGGRFGMVIKIMREACSIAAESYNITQKVLGVAHGRAVDIKTVNFNPFLAPELREQDASDAFFSVLRQSGYSEAHALALAGRAAKEEEIRKQRAGRRKSHIEAAKKDLGC